MHWTHFRAGSAADAFFLIEHQLWLFAKALWIVAPWTAHIAALKKYGRSYTRSVVNRESLNIKNYTFHSKSHTNQQPSPQVLQNQGKSLAAFKMLKSKYKYQQLP